MSSSRITYPTLLWRRVRLTAPYHPDQPQALETALALSRFLAAHLSAEPRLERVEDRIWEWAWLDDFAPRVLAGGSGYTPKGQSAEDPDAVVVELDPGLAFGTGCHPMTALCLRCLEGAELKGKTVIDYGCGSGVLAIAALRLGATRAIVVDHDLQALKATRANTEHNAVADRLFSYLSEKMPETAVGLLLANILAGPLLELAATGDRSSWQAFFVTSARKSRQPTHLGLGWTRPGPWTNGCR